MTRGPRVPRVGFRVAHESPGRLRLKSSLLWDPTLDVDYLAALLESLPGVSSARVNIAARSVVVEHAGGADMKDKVLATLNNLPGEAFLPEPNREEAPDLLEVSARAAFAAATPFLPLPVRAALSWLVAAPCLLRGAETLLSRGLKIETLDASVKLFSLLRRDYFTTNTVGALISMGENMEHSTAQRTNELLKSLLQPQVESVVVERDDVETVTPFAEVRIGDLVVCGPGQLVPVDGLVLRGEADVNMSSITGESAPAHFQPEDEIPSGGVVEDGKLWVRAERVGSETSMARIGAYIEKSLRNKSKTQLRSEKTADRLVPLTFAAGIGLYALTGDLARAASVLTVDYSCAIKLSTPVAVRSAMYAAGLQGVLLKGSQALDALARVDAVVFDKTGTLTRGALRLTDTLPLSSLSEDELLTLAAAAEEHYAHPVAKAVVSEAKARGLTTPTPAKSTSSWPTASRRLSTEHGCWWAAATSFTTTKAWIAPARTPSPAGRTTRASRCSTSPGTGACSASSPCATS